MSWGLGWKRATETFHLSLYYGTEDTLEDYSPTSSSRSSSDSSFSSNPENFGQLQQQLHIQSQNPFDLGFRIDLEWNAGDDEDQVALRLQSQVMVALPAPQDSVELEFRVEEGNVGVEMKVLKRREPLRAVTLGRVGGWSHVSDGMGVLVRLLRSNFSNSGGPGSPVGSGEGDGRGACADHWKNVTLVSLCGCGLAVLPVEITRLPHLEKLYLDNNKLGVLPPYLGELKDLKVLTVDYNMLVSVPVELRQCVALVELSLEHNKLVRPLLDFRVMAELRVLRLFGNPLEFLPEILPLHKLHHLTLANIRIVADDNLRAVNVQIETENSSYFVASRHKLSAFFSLIFRFSSCHHPLLASALAKIMQDEGNRVVVSKDENAVRQLISMISSDNQHVVEQACSALSSLASDILVAMQLMKSDIMKPIERVLRSAGPEDLISVLQIVVQLAFTSDSVSQKMLTKDSLKSLKLLCAHKNTEVQRLALLAVGNLAFSLENRSTLVTSESLRELLLRLTSSPVPRVSKAAARALAILGENESLRRAIKGRPVAKQGLRILTMDGGGMKGLATVQILREIEKGTGRQMHEMFDLICGTSTGGMLAVALGIKLMTLDKCEDIYKKLGKLVFAEPVPKDNEAATWREKLDQLYKSSSQSFRVVVHGSKHSADQFERLLKEMCADEDGDLIIESAVKGTPKVFVVSSLVSVVPAQPFIFRNYQYPVGTVETPLAISESQPVGGSGSPTIGAKAGYKRNACLGSCKHQVWQSIFALREAQLLWPDAKVDCLVSIGCGSVSTKCIYNEWRGFFGWTSDIRSLFARSCKEQESSSLRTVPFILVDGGIWPYSDYVVVNMDGSRHPIPLVTVYHHLQPITASPYTFLQALFGHEYPVGLLDEEKILPLGKDITAVGICSLKNGTPEIKSCKDLPYFMSDMTKEQMLVDLAFRTKVLFWSGVVLSSLAIGVLGYAAVRNWNRWKEWRQVRRVQQDNSAASSEAETQVVADEETGDIPDGELCVICLMRRRRSAFIPCGHLVCCQRCALSIEREESPKCPVCRQSIRTSVRIYDS